MHISTQAEVCWPDDHVIPTAASAMSWCGSSIADGMPMSPHCPSLHCICNNRAPVLWQEHTACKNSRTATMLLHWALPVPSAGVHADRAGRAAQGGVPGYDRGQVWRWLTPGQRSAAPHPSDGGGHPQRGGRAQRGAHHCQVSALLYCQCMLLHAATRTR